ncbi:hypothetical protein KX729_23325 [Rhizobium sp. XQZ8]|uniref:hypothetical protein n=1 Tax=Rhizobium populisoli TaxID=2859785 RepID=UPI001CA51EA6|nr:hypothetical protein [Rhizobium populisoli]MBW6424389.1 hypothetical protein [Rhizobium populisoli]
MWGVLLALVLGVGFLVAIAAGTLCWLLFALAASVGGALIGVAMRLNEPAIYILQMAAPAILILAILCSAAADRIARNQERRQILKYSTSERLQK